jgi:polysaccharide chain length determinant protein (PEP-CTERM system associated)
MGRRGASQGITAIAAAWSRRRWLATLVFIVPLTFTVGLAMFLPNIYRATATVLIGRQQVSENFVKTSVTSELETRLRTISQEILSRSRLQDLITRFDLYPEMRARSSMEEVTERMRRDIHMEELKEIQQAGGRTTIAFTLSYRGRSPHVVATITNILASMFIQENLALRERQAAGTAEFLRVQLDEMKKKLDEEERRVGQFKERHIGELPEQQDANLATLERLNTELRLNSENQMRVMERLERETLTRQLTEAGRITDPGAVAGAPETMAARLTRLHRELAELQTRFSEKYPDVIRVRAEIAALEHALAEKNPDEASTTKPTSPKPSSPRIKRLRSEGESELHALQEEEKALRKDIALYQRRIDLAPHREQEFQELSRNYKTTKELYNTLWQRYQEAQVAQSMEHGQKGDQFRILDPAIVPKDPAGPNRARILLIGLILSFVLATGTVMLAEQFDDSFHSVEDLRAFTKIPVLVSIPRIVTEADISRMRWQFRLGATAALLGVMLIFQASYYLARDNEWLAFLLVRSQS